MNAITINLVALLTLIPSTLSQEKFIMEANFEGRVEGVYRFVDMDERQYDFSDVNLKAFRKYNLDSDKYVGKRFKVTYWTDREIDGNDMAYEVFIIVNLDMIN